MTFGLLLLARPPLPTHLLVVPLAWAILGPLGAVPQGATEDIGLFVVGIIAVGLVVVRDGLRRPEETVTVGAD